MKNGFKLALLMAMLVAMVAVASATAPTIGNLPTLIVGDAGDIAGEGTAALHLLRFPNAVDLAAKVTPSAEVGTNGIRVMYTSSEGTLKIGKPAIVGAMTTAEKDALVLNGTEPAASKQMANVAVGLIYDVKGGATAIDTATPEANGSTTTTIDAAGILGDTNKKTITLYAVDDDVLTSAQVSPGKAFDVYAMLNAPDGTEKILVQNYDFSVNDGGWTFDTDQVAGMPGWGAGTDASNGSAIGFNSTAGNEALATWKSPNAAYDQVNGIDASNMSGKIFEAIATMSGNAASASAAPGFRFLFLSAGASHSGGFMISTPASGAGSTAQNAPWTGNNKEVRMYWAVPSDLTEYADGAYLDGQMPAPYAFDARDYNIQFDLVKADTGDAGSLMLESFVVSKLARPEDTTPAIAWGGSGTAFNAGDTAWQTGVGYPGLLDNGVATVSASSVRLANGSTASFYAKANPNAFGTGYLPIEAANSNKLLRMKLNVSASANTAPSMRVLTTGYNTALTGVVGMWGEQIDPMQVKGKYTPTNHSTLAGQPKAAGSNLDCYVWTNQFGTEAGTIQPQIDAFDAAGAVNSWAKPNYVQLNSMSMELPDQQP